MNSTLVRFNDAFGRLPNWALAWRWPILAIGLLATLAALYGSSKIYFDNTYESWFDQDDPALIAMDRFREQFGSDDSVFLVYRAKDGNVFSQQSLAGVAQLIAQLEEARHQPDSELARIQRIQGLTNVRIQRSTEDALISEPLVPTAIPSDPVELERIQQLALAQDSLRLMYFSDNLSYGAINIQTNFGAVPLATEQDWLSMDFALDELSFDWQVDQEVDAEPLRRQFQNMEVTEYLAFFQEFKAIYHSEPFLELFDFFPMGNAALVELSMDSMVQMGLLLLLMLLIVIAMLWLLLHSWAAVVWPSLAIALCTLWVVGFCGLFDIQLNQMLSLTATLILAVGIADCVHVMSSYLYYRRQPMEHHLALSKAYQKTALPILLTSITTAAAMLALTINPMPQFRIFGYTAAAGVMLALVFTYFLLPILLHWWHPKAGTKAQTQQQPKNKLVWLLRGHWLQPLLDAIPLLVARAPKAIALGFLALFLLFAYGTSQVRIDTNMADLFKEGTSLSQAYRIVDREMMGTGSLTLMIDMQQSMALQQPEVLQAIADLQQRLASNYPEQVVRTFSLADLVMDTYEVMTQRPGRIPEQADAVTQLLYLFNSANPEDRRALVSDDYSQTHISISLRNAGSRDYALLFESIEADIEAHLGPLLAQYPEMTLTPTGTLALMMRLADDLSQHQFDSLLLAAVLISVLLMLTLGSVQAGLLGMIPNLLPALFAFGFLGLMGLSLDSDTILIAPLIIGIAVDDTIHFLSHYRIALAKSRNMMLALRQTIKEVGQAVTFTTLILGLGFLMLSFSDYLGIARIGYLGATALFIALLCDLLLIPALIMIFKPKFGLKEVDCRLSLSHWQQAKHSPDPQAQPSPALSSAHTGSTSLGDKS